MIRLDFVFYSFLISKRNCIYNRQKWPFLIIYIHIYIFSSFSVFSVNLPHLHTFRGSRRRWIPRLGKKETWLIGQQLLFYFPCENCFCYITKSWPYMFLLFLFLLSILFEVHPSFESTPTDYNFPEYMITGNCIWSRAQPGGWNAWPVPLTLAFIVVN